MRKIWTGILLGAWAAGFVLAAAEQKRFQVSFGAGGGLVLGYGSQADYRPGENDFPVTPKHTSWAFSGAARYLFKARWGIEARGAFYPKSKVTLTDPSDGDTVVIDTAGHFEITANAVFYIVRREKLGVYLLGGAGFDKILAKDQSFTSSKGAGVFLGVPDKTIDALVLAGSGFEFDLSRKIGIKLDVHYRLILAKPSSIQSVDLTAGFFLRF